MDKRIIEILRLHGLDDLDYDDFIQILLNNHDYLEHIDGHLNRIEKELKNINQNKCRFSEVDASTIHLVTGGSDNKKEREKEKKYLERWIKKASKELIISDPYFFSYSGPNKVFSKLKEYTNFICNLIPKELSKLEIFHLPSPNGEVKNKIVKELRSRGTKLSFFETKEIHDRVFIRDQYEAILVGTSLGGYGNKLAFVLDVPSVDLEIFKVELDRIRGL